MQITRRRRVEEPAGSNQWQVAEEQLTVDRAKAAIVICDVWDDHWCRHAAQRCAVIAMSIDILAKMARERGTHIIHAPSDCMDFYAEHPQRKRMSEIPKVDPPPEREVAEGPFPIAAPPDQGCDDETYEVRKAWTREDPSIEIAPDDGISDNGAEIYSYFREQGIEHMFLMGVHTNMCILGRSFGIKQMVKWGVDVTLVRDLTDAMYDPRTWPHVTHDEGTQLVVEWIEKYWCPTMLSQQLL